MVVDPASNWPLFAEKARQLISQDKVAVVFGCWTSVSRKSVLPVFKELNGLLFYPVQYEGEELEKNVFYTGAAPEPAGHPRGRIPDVARTAAAPSASSCWAPTTSTRAPPTRSCAPSCTPRAWRTSDIEEVYTPFGHSDYQTIVANIKKFAAGGKTAVISTINGDSNVPFYKELGNAGLKATEVPVVAFSVGEEELRGVDTKPLVGHLAAWNYFMSLKNPENEAFIKKYKAWAKKQNLPNADKVVTNDPMEATYVGIHMWKQAVEKAKSTDTDKVIAAMAGQTFKAPYGFMLTMDKNHHLHKPVFIGEIRADGQFNVVWKTKGPIQAQPWSPYIPGNEQAERRSRRPRPMSAGSPPTEGPGAGRPLDPFTLRGPDPVMRSGALAPFWTAQPQARREPGRLPHAPRCPSCAHSLLLFSPSPACASPPLDPAVVTSSPRTTRATRSPPSRHWRPRPTEARGGAQGPGRGAPADGRGRGS